MIRPNLTWPARCYPAQILRAGRWPSCVACLTALPKVSTMGSFFTITLFFAIRRTPSTSVTVTTMGRPSGMAATARLGMAETQQLQHRGHTKYQPKCAKGTFHGVSSPACICVSEWERAVLTTGTPHAMIFTTLWHFLGYFWQSNSFSSLYCKRALISG